MTTLIETRTITVALIKDAGFEAVERDMLYNHVQREAATV